MKTKIKSHEMERRCLFENTDFMAIEESLKNYFIDYFVNLITTTNAKDVKYHEKVKGNYKMILDSVTYWSNDSQGSYLSFNLDIKRKGRDRGVIAQANIYYVKDYYFKRERITITFNPKVIDFSLDVKLQNKNPHWKSGKSKELGYNTDRLNY